MAGKHTGTRKHHPATSAQKTSRGRGQQTGKSVRQSAPPPPDGDARQVMIAEAAYFIAERRAFDGDAALDDWLEAERQIDALLGD